MSPIEQKLTDLLTELAGATPVEGRPYPVRTTSQRPEYPVAPIEGPSRPSGRGRVLVAAAAVLVAVVIGGLLVLGRGGDSPVSVSAADLPVDTAALGSGRMAVVIENDLYVADGPSGEVWRLTDTGRGEEVSMVSFSHDGEWVAFTIHDESGLWVSRWNGSERHRIGRAPSSYVWSPTDDQLAYTTQREVVVAEASGGHRALPTSEVAAPAGFTPVVWSPDGMALGFQGVEGHPQFLTLDGAATGSNPDADWLLAWPRVSMTLVDVGVEGFERRNLAADVRQGEQVVTRLADLSSAQLPSRWAATTDRVVAISSNPGAVTACSLDDLSCASLDVPFAPQGYSDPAVSPDGARVALVGGLSGIEAEGTTLVVSDLVQGGHRELGRVDVGSRGNVAFGTVLYGIGPEPPVWIDNTTLLVRVEGSSVVVVDVVAGTRTPVVVGDRFLPPADDYPGGTGLAYWSPASG